MNYKRSKRSRSACTAFKRQRHRRHKAEVDDDDDDDEEEHRMKNPEKNKTCKLQSNDEAYYHIDFLNDDHNSRHKLKRADENKWPFSIFFACHLFLIYAFAHFSLTHSSTQSPVHPFTTSFAQSLSHSIAFPLRSSFKYLHSSPVRSKWMQNDSLCAETGVTHFCGRN